MKRGISVDIYDALAVAGSIVLAVGVGMIYVPAGVIVLGAALLVAGVLGARSQAVKKL